MDYIPKFLAAATIGAHPDTFGFESYRSKQEWPEIASVDFKLGEKIKLSEIAKRAKLPESELLRFNPQLAQILEHPTLKKIKIWMPKDSANRFVARKTKAAVAMQSRAQSVYPE